MLQCLKQWDGFRVWEKNKLQIFTMESNHYQHGIHHKNKR